MFNVHGVLLVTIAVFLLGAKFSIDGYEVWRDWGALALSGFSCIVCYLFTWFTYGLNNYNNTCLIYLENRTAGTVYVQWGDARERSFGYGEYIPLEPNRVVARRVQSRLASLSSCRPCVRVLQSRNNTDRNATLILWEPQESCLTKVYEITDDGITQFRDPTERKWHAGDVNVYQS
jgi:hypothetical protein